MIITTIHSDKERSQGRIALSGSRQHEVMYVGVRSPKTITKLKESFPLVREFQNAAKQ
jgi:hypothetical protein